MLLFFEIFYELRFYCVVIMIFLDTGYINRGYMNVIIVDKSIGIMSRMVVHHHHHHHKEPQTKNSPANEDRFYCEEHVKNKTSEETDMFIVGVLDGHDGVVAADLVAERLPTIVFNECFNGKAKVLLRGIMGLWDGLLFLQE